MAHTERTETHATPDGARSRVNGGSGNDRVAAPPREPGVLRRDGAAALTAREEFGGTTFLLADMRTAFLLVNAARHQIIKRLFGISKEQENLLTVIVVSMLADAARDRIHRVAAMPGTPSLGDGLLGVGSLRALLYGVAGQPVQDTPMLGTLLMLAVVGGTAGPAVAKSLRGVRVDWHRASGGFHHRYGYLVDPGHWRQRRAQRQNDKEWSQRAPQT